MKGRKITAAEYRHTPVKLNKARTIKVLKGNTIIDDPFLKIPANTFTWFVLVPAEFITELNWNQIFRTAFKNRMIKKNDSHAKLEYENYTLANGSLLFAFK